MYSKLTIPKGRIDVVMDTDAFNESDDQFAIAYLFGSQAKCNIRAIYAAPFLNCRAATPKEGMEQSYEEIMRLLRLMGNDSFRPNVFRGAAAYMKDPDTPVLSDAARDLAARAMQYSPENPLYVLALGAATDIAAALLLEPRIAENIVVVWLAGNSREVSLAREFNLRQDYFASKLLFERLEGSMVLLPCKGVVSALSTTIFELEHYIGGKNALCDYLIRRFYECEKHSGETSVWSRPIWDVAVVAYLLSEEGSLTEDTYMTCPVLEPDLRYSQDTARAPIKYVTYINRDAIFGDLFGKLSDLARLKYCAEHE